MGILEQVFVGSKVSFRASQIVLTDMARQIKDTIDKQAQMLSHEANIQTKLLEPIFDEVRRVCCLLDKDYSAGQISKQSPILLLKAEFSTLIHFLLILLKNGFDEGSFETAHLPKIGGHLLTLVLIIGLSQFSQIVKLVLRFDLTISDSKLSRLFDSVPHGQNWKILFMPMKRIATRNKSVSRLS